MRPPPVKSTAENVLRWGRLRESWVAVGSTPASSDPARLFGIKRVSSLFSLPYWQELPIRNTLDVMHIERNVSDNILKHLFGEKDNLETRRDMEHAGLMHELHLVQSSSGNYVKPKAPYVFSEREKRDFLSLVSSTKVPSGFSSTLTKHIGERRLNGLKSHDHHVLLQQILPAAVRNFLTRSVRDTIIRLGNLFQRICAIVIRKSEIVALRTLAAEVLCLLEINFPPGFFDIMTHLVVHLVDELEICGPVHARWCYSIERYLGVLTKYVRDKSKPEAGIASGYMIDESLGFCTEYFELYEHSRSRVWDPEEDLKESGECLLGKPKLKRLTARENDMIHEYVLKHSIHTEELLGEWTHQKDIYKQRRVKFVSTLRRRPGDPIGYPPELSTPFPSFPQWLNDHVRRLKEEGFPVSHQLDSLHCPPSHVAWSFNSMWAYGAHYTCNSETVPTTVAFDCGIATIPPSQTSTEIDVGILKSILLIQYLDLSLVVMEGSWIRSVDQGRRVVRKDMHGFWTVHYSLRELRDKDNPFVYPSTVSQVFFIADSVDPGWKVVLRHDPRGKRIQGEEDVQIFAAPGSTRPSLSTRSQSHATSSQIPTSDEQPEVVPVEQFNAFVLHEEGANDDGHFDDNEYEDAVDLQYLE